MTGSGRATAREGRQNVAGVRLGCVRIPKADPRQQQQGVFSHRWWVPHVVRNVDGNVSVEIVALTQQAANVTLPNGAGTPTWSSSGQFVAYIDDEGRVKYVDIETGSIAEVQLPSDDSRADTVEWGPTEGTLAVQMKVVNFDVGVRSEKLLVVNTSTGETTPVVVWFGVT